MARFDQFILLAEMRTGSNFLEASLNNLPGLRCFGEAFNPHFIGHAGQSDMLGISMAERAHDPLALIARMRQEVPLPGFRFFHDHDPRVLAHCLPDPRCAKIVLTRNPIDSYVSRKIASATGQWKLTDIKFRKAAKAEFDAAEFEEHLRALQEFQVDILRGLQVTGQTAFYIGYDDINDVEVLNGLAAFLGLEARLDAPSGALKRQNPDPVVEKVLNPDQMERALARLDRFNLSATPNFEPRRGPAVPSFVAGRRVPLLYMPVKGGLEDALQGWLAAADGGPLIADFTQKSLREWKRGTPGHRTFSVVRHPLARAHAVFARYILGGEFPVIRKILQDSHGFDLGGDESYGAGRFRADFLRFLQFLKANLAGQTEVRVDPAWASQQRVLQGFASFALPDAVLREEALEEQLGQLAAQVGAASPPLPAPAAPVVPLAEIHGPDLEDAARAAYPGDYMTFGYARWRQPG
jgi:hypothetical protein